MNWIDAIWAVSGLITAIASLWGGHKVYRSVSRRPKPPHLGPP